MSVKLDNTKTVPKAYCSIINKYLSNKKTSIIPPVLLNGELASKANFILRDFCRVQFKSLNILN